MMSGIMFVNNLTVTGEGQVQNVYQVPSTKSSMHLARIAICNCSKYLRLPPQLLDVPRERGFAPRPFNQTQENGLSNLLPSSYEVRMRRNPKSDDIFDDECRARRVTFGDTGSPPMVAIWSISISICWNSVVKAVRRWCEKPANLPPPSPWVRAELIAT